MGAGEQINPLIMLGKYINKLKGIEAEEVDTLISRLRAMEARNLRAVLQGLIEVPPSPKEIINLFNRCRKRTDELVARPDYAGNHNFVNK